MSLDVHIKFKEERLSNYFLEHPYSYSHLSDADKTKYSYSTEWWGNITHNLGEMARHIPVTKIDSDGCLYEYNLYQVCWRPEEQDWHTTDEILPMLIDGIQYMVAFRKDLLQYEAPNGWGTYVGFLKFLLNYKEACEDNPRCEITVSR